MKKSIKITVTDDGFRVKQQNLSPHEAVGLLRLAHRQIETDFIVHNHGKSVAKIPQIKEYAEVKIGDIAYPNPCDNDFDEDDFLGKVIWKGTTQELKESEFASLMEDWVDNDSEVNFDEYDLLVLEDDHDVMYRQGPTLFNYNNDPSGCVVYKK